MHSANLELVQSIYAAWERGDFSSAEWAHPEIKLVVVDGPEPFNSRGVARMAAGWREWLSVWEDFRIGTDEYRELDDGRVLALSHYSARDRVSGPALGLMRGEAALLFDVREGKVIGIVGYNDRERALADLSLSSALS
jgi:hypothetical protein